MNFNKIALLLLICLLTRGTVFAVDGYDQFRFGMTFDDAKKINSCQWELQNIDIPGMMIFGHKNVDLYKCRTYPYEGREIELYLEFYNHNLHRIILDISLDEDTNLKALEIFKTRYGFKNGEEEQQGRRKKYSFDDKSVEVEMYDPPLNLMYLRFYSDSYNKLIRQPSLKGLST